MHEHGHSAAIHPDIDPAHTHDDHHIGPDFDGPIEEHPLWQRDHVILNSVGIDVGSAGTQVLFSRVHLRRQSIDLCSRYMVVSRETLFQSPVSLTPYSSETRIDGPKLGAIVDEAYEAAGFQPDDIDTGVVILTGEALRRENAEPIARILSEKCGELVCATAGHHMEALLAAHGSGATRISHDRSENVLNIDIGGGTTKLTLIEQGKPVTTAAYHVGGRLLAVDEQGVLERLDPAGATHAERASVLLKIGEPVADKDLGRIAEEMARSLVAVLTETTPDQDDMALYLTDHIADLSAVQSMVFSGGVAEFFYHREPRDFGDLGLRLGRALRQKVDDGKLPWTLISDTEGIRSTALGASEYTIQLSGNTGYISKPEALLPRRNIPVLQPDLDLSGEIDVQASAEAIRRHLENFDQLKDAQDVVLALHWQGTPEFSRIDALAEAIIQGTAQRLQRGSPLYLILDSDIAMTLGALLREDKAIENEMMVIDGVALWDFDFVDLGRLRWPSCTVPVTIKSLVFRDVEHGRKEILHHKAK
jgi:ethanolamine utilization protein EutA